MKLTRTTPRSLQRKRKTRQQPKKSRRRRPRPVLLTWFVHREFTRTHLGRGLQRVRVLVALRNMYLTSCACDNRPSTRLPLRARPPLRVRKPPSTQCRRPTAKRIRRDHGEGTCLRCLCSTSRGRMVKTRARGRIVATHNGSIELHTALTFRSKAMTLSDFVRESTRC